MVRNNNHDDILQLPGIFWPSTDSICQISPVVPLVSRWILDERRTRRASEIHYQLCVVPKRAAQPDSTARIDNVLEIGQQQYTTSDHCHLVDFRRRAVSLLVILPMYEARQILSAAELRTKTGQ